MPSAPVVILTREHDDNLALVERLAQLGIDYLEYPCIATRLLPYAGGPLCNGKNLEDFAVIAFASKRGAAGMRPVAKRLKNYCGMIAAVGQTTASGIEQITGRKADILAEPQTGEGLARSIMARVAKGPVLYVRGSKTSGELKEPLERNGFEVCDLVVYENYTPEVVPLELDRQAIAVFASPSAAEAFFWANIHLKYVVWCVAIGPTTEQALSKLGAKKVSTSPKPDNDHLLQMVLELVRGGGLE